MRILLLPRFPPATATLQAPLPMVPLLREPANVCSCILRYLLVPKIVVQRCVVSRSPIIAEWKGEKLGSYLNQPYAFIPTVAKPKPKRLSPLNRSPKSTTEAAINSNSLAIPHMARVTEELHITMKAALHSVMNLTSRQTNNITSLSVNATVPPPLQMKRC